MTLKGRERRSGSISQQAAKGLNRSRGRGGFDPASGVADREVLFRKSRMRHSASYRNRSRAMKDSTREISPLRHRMIEDMRMRKLSTKTQTVPIFAPCGTSPGTWVARPTRQRLRICATSNCIRRSRRLADHAQRHDHGTEVLLRCDVDAAS